MKYLQAHIRGSVDTFMRLKIRQEICASYCTLGKGLVAVEENSFRKIKTAKIIET